MHITFTQVLDTPQVSPASLVSNFEVAKGPGGTVIVSFVATVSGSYTLRSYIGGADLQGSPIQIEVTAGAVDPANCIAWGDALTSGSYWLSNTMTYHLLVK